MTLPPLPTIPVVDLHVDTPWKVHFKGRSVALKRGHATPKTLEAGGYRGIVYPIYLADYLNDGHPRIADADAVLKTIRKMVRAHDILAWAPGQPGFTGLPLPPGRIGVYIAIEGAGAFADDITQIDRFIAAGVRLVGPVHAGDNRLSTSATGRNARGQGKKKGLSELGRALCERVYRAGALVDVSHMSDAAFADLEPIAARFSAPIVATHSNARALSPHPRNLTDTQLRAIAKTGGVAGLNIYKGFVGRGRHPKLRDVVAQVEHMVKVAGIEHVAIGSDYDGGTPVAALADASAWPKLITALRKAGFGDAALRKLFAENALRILAYRPTSARP